MIDRKVWSLIPSSLKWPKIDAQTNPSQLSGGGRNPFEIDTQTFSGRVSKCRPLEDMQMALRYAKEKPVNLSALTHGRSLLNVNRIVTKRARVNTIPRSAID